MDNTNELLNNIGDNLRSFRLSKGLERKEIADIAGISVSQYGRIENGTTKASVLMLVKIVKALNVGMDELVFGEKMKTGNDLIILKDKELVQKMKELDELNDEDKEVAHQLLDLILTQKKLNELTNSFQKLSKK
jgi:transcriptional regulator with XRE-family HTH domain